MAAHGQPSDSTARSGASKGLPGNHLIHLFQENLPARLLPLAGVLRIPKLIWLTDYLVLFQSDDETKITRTCSDFP